MHYACRKLFVAYTILSQLLVYELIQEESMKVINTAKKEAVLMTSLSQILIFLEGCVSRELCNNCFTVGPEDGNYEIINIRDLLEWIKPRREQGNWPWVGGTQINIWSE